MNVRIRSVIRLACPYIIMALLPIVSVFFLSNYILNSHTEQILADHQNTIEVAVERVNQKIATVEELSYLIIRDDSIIDYVFNNWADVENDYFLCDEIQDLLSGISKNDSIAQIYYYDIKTGRIISADTVLNDAELFFRYLYKYESYSPEQVIEHLNMSPWGYRFCPAETVDINNRRNQVIEYRLSVPLKQYGEYPSQLVIGMDVATLLQDCFDAMDKGAEFYLYSGDKLLYSNGYTYVEHGDAKLTDVLQVYSEAEGKVYATEHSCNNGAWRIQFFYPELSQRDSGQVMTGHLVWAVALPVVLCICVCIFFTHKKHREIVDILALLRGEEPVEEEPEHRYIDYQLVRSYAGQVVERNRVYRTKLREIHISQKSSALERLIRNAYRSNTEKKNALAALELQIQDEKCVALCVQFDEIFSESFTINDMTVRDMITRLLETNISTSMEVFDNLPTEVVCILAVEDGVEAVVEDIISLLNVQIKYQYGIDLRIGVGNVVDTIYDISLSYNQAREVIRYSESTGKGINVYGQIDSLDEVMFYPVLTDEKISNYIIAGRAEEAKSVILSIYVENFLDNTRMLSLETINLVKYRITNAVMTAAEKHEVSIPEGNRKFLKEKNIKNYFMALTELVDVIVEEITTKKNNAQNILAVKVMDYVREHYMDSGLSIKQIANHFHFHENYISNLYKEEYGENLSSAIERHRIEKACELLSTTETRVGEVAAAVGYSSDSSFRRAFKKTIGVSPVDYRNSH